MRQNHVSSNKASKRNQTRQPAQAAPESSPRPKAASNRRAPAVSSEAERELVVAERIDSAKRKARYDRPGHLAEAHAERLLRLSRARGAKDEFAMVFDAAASDELATELGEQAVTSMVGSGETWLDMVNAPVDEEEGGPFLETRGAREFAAGDESEGDTEGFLREALPTSSASPSVPFGRVRRRR